MKGTNNMARFIQGASFALVLSLAASLAACSGGGAQPPNTTPAASSSAVGGGSISFAVPIGVAPKSIQRDAKYISASTASLIVAMRYSFPYVSAAPLAYARTFNVASDCPVVGGFAICSVTLSSLAPRPSNIKPTVVGVSAAAYTGQNGTGTLVSISPAGAACSDAFDSNPSGVLTSCRIVLGAIVSSFGVTQSVPIVAGAPTTSKLTTIALDAVGGFVGDTTAASCMLDSSANFVSFGTTFSDPHVSLVVNHTFDSAGPLNDGSIAYQCFEGPNGLGPTYIVSASDTIALTSDGVFAPPATLTLTTKENPALTHVTVGPNGPYIVAEPTTYVGPFAALPQLSFTPLTIPKTHVTLSGVGGAAQTLVVTPPATFTGIVKLAVSGCLAPAATTTGTNATNVAASPLITATSSAPASTSGSPVSFVITPTGAGTGTCLLTSSADSSVYGAVVSW